jgi:hypothetical protein
MSVPVSGGPEAHKALTFVLNLRSCGFPVAWQGENSAAGSFNKQRLGHEPPPP